MLDSQNEIISKFKNGDTDAFKQLFHQYYPLLCRYALRFTPDMDMAEEIVQEVFVKIWEKKQEIEWKVSFKSYLYRMVHNACLNSLKHKKIMSRYEKYYMQQYNESPSDFLTIEKDIELEVKIQKAIDDLPEKNRKVFSMSRFDGFKYHEIAEKLGISVKTVEAQMSMALKTLRIKLKDFLSMFVLFFLTNLL